jgi:hypothetical protein
MEEHKQAVVAEQGPAPIDADATKTQDDKDKSRPDGRGAFANYVVRYVPESFLVKIDTDGPSSGYSPLHRTGILHS